MNKTFFSLLLIVSMAVTISSFATEIKEEVKSQIPENVKVIVTQKRNKLDDLQNTLKSKQNDLIQEQEKSEKQSEETIEKLTKDLEKIQQEIALEQLSLDSIDKYIKETYNKTTLDTIASPMKKIANFFANNVKAAVAVEAVAVLAATVAVYNYFFAAQDDEDEDFE